MVVARGRSVCWRATKEANLAAARQSAIHNCTMTGSRFADCRSSSGVVARGPECLLASDEGGESAGCPSECTMTGSHSPRER